MKTKLLSASIFAFLICYRAFDAFAVTTIDAANKYAYAANLGWVDWRGDTNSGAVIGEYVCAGNIYSANVGWINLGSGTPANQIQYQNNSATDYGVNHDGLGNLRGYAYAANIGWLNFENTGAAKVDLFTGNLSGSVYSANCGWISLSNSVALVQTDTIQKGALAPDGLPIAWLLQKFGTTNVAPQLDPDGDGMSNLQEYLAGTEPLDKNSNLKITYVSRVPPSSSTTLIWNSVPTRYYTIQTNSSLSVGAFGDFASPAILGFNNANFFDGTQTNRFYRIRAYRPLVP